MPSNSILGKSFLVTGATGFIGSWLAERLTRESHSITLLVRPNSPRRSCIRSFKDKVVIVKGDIRDENAVKRAVDEKDVVFHLAAITQVRHSLQNPSETYSVNVQGTLNVLEAVRKADQNQLLVYASTDKVYGEPEKLPVAEDHPLYGKSPYDASKIAAEKAVYSYFKTYGLRVAISRSSNVYGGRDMNLLRAVPDFVSSAITQKKIVVRGSGEHIRDYMYIDDAIEAFLKVANNPSGIGEAFNFGTGKPTRVIELADLVAKLAGNVKVEMLRRKTPGEIDVQYLDCRKAEERLGWKPEIGLEEGLLRTLDWYRANRSLWSKFRAVETNTIA